MQATATYEDPAFWQSMLANRYAIMNGIARGGRVGILAREGAITPGSDMIVWQKEASRIDVSATPFLGFKHGGVDILFVADESMLEDLAAEAEPDPVAALRGGLAEGRALIYYLKSGKELVDLGFEDFVELIGLARVGCQ